MCPLDENNLLITRACRENFLVASPESQPEVTRRQTTLCFSNAKATVEICLDWVEVCFDDGFDVVDPTLEVRQLDRELCVFGEGLRVVDMEEAGWRAVRGHHGAVGRDGGMVQSGAVRISKHGDVVEDFR